MFTQKVKQSRQALQELTYGKFLFSAQVWFEKHLVSKVRAALSDPDVVKPRSATVCKALGLGLT